MQIFVFGGSIAWGAYDDEGAGWANRLLAYCMQEYLRGGEYCPVYNLAISGDTTKGVLERMESELKRRIDNDQQTVFILAIGTNDTLHLNEARTTMTSHERFQENIEKIIVLAKKYSQKIVFLGLPLVDQQRVDPVPWLEQYSYKNDIITEFDAILKTTVREQDCIYIDPYKVLLPEMYVDGVHPNAEGHKLVFEMVLAELKKLNLI